MNQCPAPVPEALQPMRNRLPRETEYRFTEYHDKNEDIGMFSITVYFIFVILSEVLYFACAHSFHSFSGTM